MLDLRALLNERVYPVRPVARGPCRPTTAGPAPTLNLSRPARHRQDDSRDTQNQDRHYFDRADGYRRNRRCTEDEQAVENAATQDRTKAKIVVASHARDDRGCKLRHRGAERHYGCADCKQSPGRGDTRGPISDQPPRQDQQSNADDALYQGSRRFAPSRSELMTTVSSGVDVANATTGGPAGFRATWARPTMARTNSSPPALAQATPVPVRDRLPWPVCRQIHQ